MMLKVYKMKQVKQNLPPCPCILKYCFVAEIYTADVCLAFTGVHKYFIAILQKKPTSRRNAV